MSDSIANSNFWPEVQRCLWSWHFFGFKIDGQCHEATFFHISPGINLELTVLISRNTLKPCTLINQCHAMYMYANATKCEFVKSQKAKMLGFLSFLWNHYSGIFFEVKWEFGAFLCLHCPQEMGTPGCPANWPDDFHLLLFRDFTWRVNTHSFFNLLSFWRIQRVDSKQKLISLHISFSMIKVSWN